MIVASHVNQSGSTIAGDVQRLVVVKTDAGYKLHSRHVGTGTFIGPVD